MEAIDRIPHEHIARCEEQLPLGYCSACVARVKGEIDTNADELSPIHAAITTVATAVGQNTVVPLPVCWYDIRIVKPAPGPPSPPPRSKTQLAVAHGSLPPGLSGKALRDLPTPPLS